MIRLLSTPDDAYRIADDGDTTIGWLRGRVVRIEGFPDVDAAIAAVVRTYPALNAALRNHYPGWPPRAPRADELSIQHDGAYEWIAQGSHPLARLIRFADRDVCALEFVLPSYATEGVALTVAQVVGSAVHASPEGVA
jgi:hypothetical protein